MKINPINPINPEIHGNTIDFTCSSGQFLATAATCNENQQIQSQSKTKHTMKTMKTMKTNRHHGIIGEIMEGKLLQLSHGGQSRWQGIPGSIQPGTVVQDQSLDAGAQLAQHGDQRLAEEGSDALDAHLLHAGGQQQLEHVQLHFINLFVCFSFVSKTNSVILIQLLPWIQLTI